MYIRNLSAGFFLILSSLVSGQNINQGMLILYRHLNPSSILILTGDKLWYKTDSLSPYKDIMITGISHDTIFYQGGRISCRTFYAIKIYPNGNPREFELSRWRIAVPPKEVYNSPEMLHVFRSWIIHNNSKDGNYEEYAWRRSKLYYNGSMIEMRNNREKKIFIKQMDTIHKHFFKFDLTRFVCFQVTYAYEYRISPLYAVEIEAGWQCRNNGPERPMTDPVTLLPSEGPMFTIGPKFYYLSHKRPFIYYQPQFLYKYTYFKKQWDLEHVTNGEAEFQDQYRNVFGMSANFGAMRSFGVFFIDLTWGFGYKYASVHQTLYYHARNPTNDPNQYRYYYATHEPDYRISHEWNPIINFLVKIGVAF